MLLSMCGALLLCVIPVTTGIHAEGHDNDEAGKNRERRADRENVGDFLICVKQAAATLDTSITAVIYSRQDIPESFK